MLRYLPVLVAVGAAIYLVIWLAQSRGERRGPAGGGSRPQRAPRRPLAPDDDPDFLAELDRRSREERRRRGGETTPPTGGTPPAPDGTPAADGGPAVPPRPAPGRAARPADAAGPSKEGAEPPAPAPDAGREGTGAEGLDGDSAR